MNEEGVLDRLGTMGTVLMVVMLVVSSSIIIVLAMMIIIVGYGSLGYLGYSVGK